MSIGIIVNSACVLIGGLLGSFFGRLLPVKMRESLYGLFGYCSIIIGIILLQNIKSMPAVTLALILGTIIGEALRIEDQINFASLRLKTLIERLTNTAAADNDAYISRFVGLLMLSNVAKIDFADFVDAMAGLVTAVFIVLTCNIVTGIMIGFATLVIGRLVSGEWRKLNIGTVVIAVALVTFYAGGSAI